MCVCVLACQRQWCCVGERRCRCGVKKERQTEGGKNEGREGGRKGVLSPHPFFLLLHPCQQEQQEVGGLEKLKKIEAGGTLPGCIYYCSIYHLVELCANTCFMGLYCIHIHCAHSYCLLLFFSMNLTDKQIVGLRQTDRRDSGTTT